MRILGIDPAWTPKNPSAFALIEQDGNSWMCKDIAPSFHSFCSNKTITERFQGRIVGERFSFKEILEKSGPVDRIVVDMPISTQKFSGRRGADNEIAKKFGDAWCATHTPTDAISKIGFEFVKEAEKEGYGFGTKLIETYPHPAILSLIPCLRKRLPYKVMRRKHYWPQDKPEERRKKIYENLQKLRECLKSSITFPKDYELREDFSFTQLKSFEDTLDALVCAWVGIKFMNGKCQRFGDDSSSIWIPNIEQ